MTDDDLLKGAEERGYEWEEAPDLTSVSEEELRTCLRELSEEERAISYRRRVLQGRIDLIRAELVRRGSVALSPEELANILLDRSEGRGTSPGEGG
jgi:hypothetical protein